MSVQLEHGCGPTAHIHILPFSPVSQTPYRPLAKSAACSLLTGPLSTKTWGKGLNLPLGEADMKIGYVGMCHSQEFL